MRFFLGTHMPNWLGLTDVPLFVSDVRLNKRKSLPVALGPWALDSGGYSQLNSKGSWDDVPPEMYAERVDRYASEIGNLQWAAIQDWMCEDWILHNTGLTVLDHQHRTIESGLTLRAIASHLPWRMVLQGKEIHDYVRMVDMYAAAGINLLDEDVVGLGSVCRRQATSEIEEIVEELAAMGLQLHGFGVKIKGLAKYGPQLTSADSMAWSYDARWLPEKDRERVQQQLGCTGHKNCANCFAYAMHWRTRVLAPLDMEVAA